MGILAKNEAGRLAVTKVTLRPRITWGGEPPSAETLARISEHLDALDAARAELARLEATA